MNIKRFVWVLIFLSFLVGLITTVSAETTFFDDVGNSFVVSSSLITGSGTITSSTMTEVEPDSRGCTYEWDCAEWEMCLQSGKQFRTCGNIGNCPDTYNAPATEQDCVYSSPESNTESASPNESEASKETPWNKTMDILTYAVVSLGVLSVISFIIFYRKNKSFEPTKEEVKAIRDNAI